MNLTPAEVQRLAAVPAVALLAVAATMGPTVREAVEAAAREYLRRVKA